jgi:hypothetical protein
MSYCPGQAQPVGLIVRAYKHEMDVLRGGREMLIAWCCENTYGQLLSNDLARDRVKLNK